MDVSSDGILISDPMGKVIYINDEYERVTGMLREEVLNEYLDKLLETGYINRAISLEVLNEGVDKSCIHRYFTGKSAVSSASIIKSEDGELLGVMNVTRNIEELQNLSRALNDMREVTKRYSYELKNLKRSINGKYRNYIYESEAMKKTIELALKVAPFDSTVLITGESGTGKEVIARYIHNKSQRKDEAFIKVNCSAIPKELFESELFGYEKGAFTGAHEKGKLGLFELANKGTLLLDEIGELPLQIQPKLLRAIQEREIYRVGGNKPIKLDVRILASTNRNLLEEVKAGNFREDLYFRLNVVPIRIPNLRERQGDVEPLLDLFLENLNKKYKTQKVYDLKAKRLLLNYNWPGNVRELENIVEYLYIISNDIITTESIPGKILSKIILNEKSKTDFAESNRLQILMDSYEKTIIEEAIQKYNTLESASSVLGIHASTLSRKMAKHNLKFNR